MKLLLDENLSPRLVPLLLSLFSGLTHVRDVGLRQAKDHVIWNFALANGYTILTSDKDFIKISQQLGWPPKVVHLEKCSYPLRTIENMLRRNGVHISEFDKDPSRGVLVIRNIG